MNIGRISRRIAVWRELTRAVLKGAWDNIYPGRGGVFDLSDSPMSRPYTKSDLVFICISTTAKAISQVPLKVYSKTADGKEEPLPEDNMWNSFFSRPNDLMDKYSFVESIVSYLMLQGNSWMISSTPFNSISPPEAVYIISRDHVKPKVNKTTNQLESWIFNPKGVNRSAGSKDIPVPLDQVAHFWFWNPYDPIMGLSPLEAGKIAIESDYKASKFNLLFFENGAQPSGVVWTEKRLGDLQFNRIKEQLQQEHAGSKRAHKMMILEDGLKYSQTSLTQKDMQFYDLRKFDMSRILQLFGMKKSIISETDNLNYATAKEQRKSWWEDTNLPIMNLIVSVLNFTLFRGTNLVCRFDTSGIEALQENFSDKVETAERLWKMGVPFNQINDRLSLGFSPLEGHDVGYLPSSNVPLDKIGLQSAAALPAPRPTREAGSEIIELEPAQVKSPEEKSPLLEWVDFNEEKAWEKYIDRMRGLEEAYEKKIKSIFYKMRVKALKALARGEKSVSDVNDLNYEAEASAIRKNSEIIYRKSILEGVAALVEEIGFDISLDLSDPIVIEYLKNKILKVVGIQRTIKRQLAKTLAVGTEEGESIDQMADRVRSVFNASARRAKTIARTEVVGSSNFGRTVAIRRSGFEYKKWYTAKDERVRPHHVAMHNKTIRTDQVWIVGGQKLRYPGDYSGPPGEIINCRCIEVVVPTR